VNNSGGKWPTPDAALIASIRTEIDKREAALAAKTKPKK